MIPILNISLKYLLADAANARITLSEASQKLNERQPTHSGKAFRTVGDMEHGKFRRMFDRHRVAYKLFN